MANTITHSLSYSKEDVQKYFLQPMFVQSPALSYFEVLTNVKASQKLDKFSSKDKITKAEAAGFSASTGVTYTQRSITVARMEAEFEQSGGAFFNSIKGELLKSGLNKDDISGTVLQRIVADIMLKGVQRDFERQIWFGDTGSGSADYSAYNGIMKALQSLPAANRLGITSGALSAGDAKAEFKRLVEAMPNEGLENRADLVLFVTRSLAENYRESLRSSATDSGFNALINGQPALAYDGIPVVEMGQWDTHIAADAANLCGSMQVPANDLDGHVGILTVKNNIVIATDFEQVNGADMWYNKDTKTNRFRFEYVVGANYKNDELTVIGDSNS